MPERNISGMKTKTSEKITVSKLVPTTAKTREVSVKLKAETIKKHKK